MEVAKEFGLVDVADAIVVDGLDDLSDATAWDVDVGVAAVGVVVSVVSMTIAVAVAGISVVAAVHAGVATISVTVTVAIAVATIAAIATIGVTMSVTMAMSVDWMNMMVSSFLVEWMQQERMVGIKIVRESVFHTLSKTYSHTGIIITSITIAAATIWTTPVT